MAELGRGGKGGSVAAATGGLGGGTAAPDRSLLEANLDPMLVLRPDGTIADANAAMERAAGRPRAELVGTDGFWGFVLDREAARRGLREVVERGERRAFPGAIRHSGGRLAAALLHATPRRDPAGAVDAVLVVARPDAGPLDAPAATPLRDPLTGLLDRAAFLERVDHDLVRPGRDGGAAAVLYLDLDRFRTVNDSLGHEAGDRLLVEAAGRIRGGVGPGATVARLAGDDFAVLLDDPASFGPDAAARLAERLAEALGAPFAIGPDGPELRTVAHVGIALAGPGPVRAGDLVRDAETAVQRAKRGGRAYELFDPSMNADALARLGLESDLRRAVERGEFRLYYQPKVAVPTEQAHGMEALLRWQHPQRGLLAPAAFLPTAEQIGLVVPIGRWVLREAAGQMRDWKGLFPDEPLSWVSINLSARQFAEPGLVDDAARALEETGLPSHHLDLEITEEVAMGDAEGSIRTLGELRELGTELSIDDFGSGYSSLSYLKRLPVTHLKIDRSFVAGVTDEPDAAIVAAIVRLAHALDVKVTAEGVETAAQLAALRRLGCQFAQGYYFARPLPPDEAAAYFERDRAEGLARGGATAAP